MRFMKYKVRWTSCESILKSGPRCEKWDENAEKRGKKSERDPSILHY